MQEKSSIVRRVIEEGPLTDIGQLSKAEKKELEKAVKKGLLKKGKGGPYPSLKTVYCVPVYNITEERKRWIEEIMSW